MNNRFFTARRYARSLLSPSVLSVRPSVFLLRWCIVSRRLKISSNFFVDPVAPTVEFLTSDTNTQFQGEPLQRGPKYTGV